MILLVSDRSAACSRYLLLWLFETGPKNINVFGGLVVKELSICLPGLEQLSIGGRDDLSRYLPARLFPFSKVRAGQRLLWECGTALFSASLHYFAYIVRALHPKTIKVRPS